MEDWLGDASARGTLVATALGGILALAGTLIVELFRQRRERNEHRGAMLLELAGTIFECRHYLHRLESMKLLKQRGDGSLVDQLGRVPLERTSCIISLYFRSMIPSMERLSKGMAIYQAWIEAAEADPANEGKMLNELPGRNEARQAFLVAADDLYERIQNRGKGLGLSSRSELDKERIYDETGKELP